MKIYNYLGIHYKHFVNSLAFIFNTTTTFRPKYTGGFGTLATNCRVLFP